VAQLYPQTTGSLFITFYNSQGYDGGVLTCLHMRALTTDDLFQVKVEDDRYWGIVFHRDHNWNQLE
jgi:hypothetical protein